MAQVNKRSDGGDRVPPYLVRLKQDLFDSLERIGVGKPKIEIIPVPGTKLWRFRVITKGFAKLRHSERQDLVWRVVAQTLDKDQQLFISVIYTLTPSEASGQSAA